jgi:drug/metabolite transporter (DMT)-like permease
VKVWIAYITVALVWGSTFFAIALGITSFTPFGMTSFRFLGAGLLALAVSRLNGEPLPLRRDLPHLMLQGVLQLTLSNTLVTWAEGSVSSGVTAVLCATSPLFYAVMGRESLGPRGWAGLLVGLGGVGVLALAGAGTQTVSLWGFAAVMVATYLWAQGTLHGRRHVRGQGLMGQVGVQMLTGGALSMALVPFAGGFLRAPLTWKAGLAVAYLAVFGSLVAYSAFIYISRAWAPSRMSTYVYINPVVAVLLGCFLLREPLNLTMVLAMAVIMAGVALLQLPRRVQPEKTCACASE